MQDSLFLPIPTPDLVGEEIRKNFDCDPVTQLTEIALTDLIRQYPLNTNPAHVLLKVVAINRLYNTNIFAVHDVARHITNLRIDSNLAQGTPDLVKRIAEVTIKDDVRNNYSFATKYCSWHNPEAYPIWDSYVDECLWAYKRQANFHDFKRQHLWDYPKFVEVVTAFQKQYGLDSLTFKEIDKFLWVKGYNLLKSRRAARLDQK